MKNKEHKVYCIIPAYNEEKNLASVIDEVKKIIPQVIVVDDGSVDNTRMVGVKSGARVVSHPINRGQGAALETGDEIARAENADIVVHFDADGQFKASEIEDLLLPLKKDQADIVFGSRFLGKKANLPFTKRYFLIPLGRAVNILLLGANFTDPQNGFRALNKKALEMIKICNDGHAHCSEILHKTKKYNLRSRELPVTVYYKGYGQSILKGKGRGAGGVQIVKDLLISKIIK